MYISIKKNIYMCKKSGLRDFTDLFSLVSSSRMHVNGLKLCHVRFRLNVRKVFFTGRVVKHWNRFLGEVVNGPSLSVFRRHLN